MHPVEFWWLYEVRTPPEYGSMTRGEVARIYEETYGGH